MMPPPRLPAALHGDHGGRGVGGRDREAAVDEADLSRCRLSFRPSD